MLWKKTSWADSDGTERECVLVSWDEVEAILGHAYDGDLQDLEQLKEAALEAGAPGWVSLVGIGHDGIDKAGVCLIDPA